MTDPIPALAIVYAVMVGEIGGVPFYVARSSLGEHTSLRPRTWVVKRAAEMEAEKQGPAAKVVALKLERMPVTDE